MQQCYDQISLYVDRMEADIADHQEKLMKLKDQVKSEVELILDGIQETLQQKKDQLLEKLDDFYSSEMQTLQDERDKKAGIAEQHGFKKTESMLSKAENVVEELEWSVEKSDQFKHSRKLKLVDLEGGDDFQERMNHLCKKVDQVKIEVEKQLEIIHEVIQQKKDKILEKVNDLYSSVQDDIRSKQVDVDEMKMGLKNMRDLMQTIAEDDVVELGRSLERKYMRYEVANKEEKPRFVDLTINVNFKELKMAVAKLPFGSIDAVYENNGQTIMKRIVDGSSPLQSPSASASSPPSPTTSTLSSSESGDGATAATGGTQRETVIYTRVREDRNKPKLNDITVVEADDVVVVVVTDRLNKCIKAFYKLQDLRFYSREAVSSTPRGIARVGSESVGVTLPESSRIKLFKVTPALRRGKEIKTSKRYRGIAMLDSERLVVSTYSISPPAVDIIDYQGTVLHSVKRDRNGHSLFDNPFYLCTTPQGNIIVSDCERRTVTCVSQTGNVIFQYGQGGEVTLKFPLGVAVNSFGDILVADCDGHKVVKILEGGQGAKDFLGKDVGILGPYSVGVDSNDIVYVLEWKGNIKTFHKT